LTKEDKDCVRPEDAVENFLVDDISSDENSDSNVLAGGNYLFWWLRYFGCQFDERRQLAIKYVLPFLLIHYPLLF
jgi:hypothetical protein